MIAINALRLCVYAASRRAPPVAASVPRIHSATLPFAASRTFAAAAQKGAKKTPGADKINGGIQASEMRVVFTDPETQKDSWKIMSKQDALQLAQSQELDLILVNPNSNPVVCKIQSYTKHVLEKAKKEKELRMKQKSVKEMSFGVVIAPHDLEVKCQKVRDFLDKGHQVQITLAARGWQLKKEPTALDRITYTVVTALEHDVASLQQLGSKSPLRRDFMLFPKKSAGAGAKKASQSKKQDNS